MQPDLARFCDDPGTIGEVLERFDSALRESAGEAAIEIGVRSGGTSAMMCRAVAGRPGFLVIGVDPWGNAPYIEGGTDVSHRLDYGTGHYQTARALLASFPNSALFRLDADLFFESVLPGFRWWERGRRYPSSERWLAFVYLDGPHDDADVARQALACLPRLAVGGRICIDDARRCRSAVALLDAVPGLEREEMSERRAGFVWCGGRCVTRP